jgi:hypothetical protein
VHDNAFHKSIEHFSSNLVAVVLVLVLLLVATLLVKRGEGGGGMVMVMVVVATARAVAWRSTVLARARTCMLTDYALDERQKKKN